MVPHLGHRAGCPNRTHAVMNAIFRARRLPRSAAAVRVQRETNLLQGFPLDTHDPAKGDERVRRFLFHPRRSPTHDSVGGSFVFPFTEDGSCSRLFWCGYCVRFRHQRLLEDAIGLRPTEPRALSQEPCRKATRTPGSGPPSIHFRFAPHGCAASTLGGNRWASRMETILEDPHGLRNCRLRSRVVRVLLERVARVSEGACRRRVMAFGLPIKREKVAAFRTARQARDVED